MGTIIALISVRFALGKEPRVPGFLGDRPLPPGVQDRVLRGSVSFLGFVEKFVRPRRTQWLGWRWVHFTNCLLLAFLALLLALPLPSPPFFFSNSIPSYAIIILAASMMEQDGLLIWFGYILVLLNLVFFSIIGGAVVQLFMKTWSRLVVLCL